MASRAEWEQRVKQWKKSGLSAKAFAAQHGLHAGTLLWWSSRLRRSVAKDAPSGFARLVPAEAAPLSTVASATLDLVLTSGRIVRVRQGFDPALLRALLAVVEAP